MKISHLLILSITVLFLTYAIHSYFTYDFTIKEAKKTTLLRNQAQANNIMQDLDRYIEQRMLEFHNLAETTQIKSAVMESNQQNPISEPIEENLVIDTTIPMTQQDPFFKKILENRISKELGSFATAYNNEYGYDAIKELFVTNQHGVVIGMSSGKSDYVQADEEWWQITKTKQNYVEPMRFDNDYNDHIVTFAYPIIGDSTNYIGTLRVSVSLRVLLTEFINDADVVQAVKKNVVLLDKDGTILYEGGKLFPVDKHKEYFPNIIEDNGNFEYTLASPTFVSYASSIGYRNFYGFGWITVIEQESSVVDEFEELEKNFLLSTIIGIISAVILSIVLSYFVTNPLSRLSQLTAVLGKGDFNVKAQQSKISEINSIANSFNEMENSLKKLFETEKKLVEANTRIKNERLTAIGELAASMAHDMKNPLGTIRSGMDIIKRNAKVDSSLEEVIQRMDRAVSRMAHQVEDVLNFVRTTPLSLKPTSLISIINSAIKSIEIPKKIQLNIDGDDLTIICDEKKLEIVFINLILNSVQSIGNDDGKISIRIKKSNTNAIIEIEDSGPGIPKQIISDIFKPLVTTKQKGTGLGLASCKNIVEQHGGKITFQNNPTIFVVTIPLEAKNE
ncbi:MAG: ATP-binding protein [Candidatus Nitrosotenuis sp.]